MAIALIGLFIALLMPAMQSAREAARRMGCANNMKQFNLAIAQYAGGRPLTASSSPGQPFQQVVNPKTGNTAQGSVHYVCLPFYDNQTVYDTFTQDVPDIDTEQAPASCSVPLVAGVGLSGGPSDWSAEHSNLSLRRVRRRRNGYREHAGNRADRGR